jgi:hypothetical protein
MGHSNVAYLSLLCHLHNSRKMLWADGMFDWHNGQGRICPPATRYPIGRGVGTLLGCKVGSFLASAEPNRPIKRGRLTSPPAQFQACRQQNF